jgi:hypothetical protein
VFGTRRGSEEAQARRDLDERRGRALALKDLRDEVEAAVGSCSTVELLARIYHTQDKPERRATLNEYLLKRLAPLQDGCTAVADELIFIIGRSDPQGWSGLTAPAAPALGHYFADMLPFSQSDPGGGVVRDQAMWAAENCFGEASYTESHYLRLQPLIEGLGAFLARQNKEEGWQLGLVAVDVLDRAPTSMLTGPLASWVSAFAQRHDQGNLSDTECSRLQNLISSQSSDAARSEALAALGFAGLKPGTVE